MASDFVISIQLEATGEQAVKQKIAGIAQEAKKAGEIPLAPQGQPGATSASGTPVLPTVQAAQQQRIAPVQSVRPQETAAAYVQRMSRGGSEDSLMMLKTSRLSPSQAAATMSSAAQLAQEIGGVSALQSLPLTMASNAGYVKNARTLARLTAEQSPSVLARQRELMETMPMTSEQAMTQAAMEAREASAGVVQTISAARRKGSVEARRQERVFATQTAEARDMQRSQLALNRLPQADRETVFAEAQGIQQETAIGDVVMSKSAAVNEAIRRRRGMPSDLEQRFARLDTIGDALQPPNPGIEEEQRRSRRSKRVGLVGLFRAGIAARIVTGGLEMANAAYDTNLNEQRATGNPSAMMSAVASSRTGWESAAKSIWVAGDLGVAMRGAYDRFTGAYLPSDLAAAQASIAAGDAFSATTLKQRMARNDLRAHTMALAPGFQSKLDALDLQQQNETTKITLQTKAISDAYTQKLQADRAADPLNKDIIAQKARTAHDAFTYAVGFGFGASHAQVLKDKQGITNLQNKLNTKYLPDPKITSGIAKQEQADIAALRASTDAQKSNIIRQLGFNASDIRFASSQMGLQLGGFNLQAANNAATHDYDVTMRAFAPPDPNKPNPLRDRADQAASQLRDNQIAANVVQHSSSIRAQDVAHQQSLRRQQGDEYGAQMTGLYGSLANDVATQFAGARSQQNVFSGFLSGNVSQMLGLPNLGQLARDFRATNDKAGELRYQRQTQMGSLRLGQATTLEQLNDQLNNDPVGSTIAGIVGDTRQQLFSLVRQGYGSGTDVFKNAQKAGMKRLDVYRREVDHSYQAQAVSPFVNPDALGLTFTGGGENKKIADAKKQIANDDGKHVDISIPDDVLTTLVQKFSTMIEGLLAK